MLDLNKGEEEKSEKSRFYARGLFKTLVGLLA